MEENLVRPRAECLSNYTPLGRNRKGRRWPNSHKGFSLYNNPKSGEGLIYNVQWFNTICGLGEGSGKCSSSIYKKVIAHLQVPVMCIKQKYKVPNQLGNKNNPKKVDLTLITVYLRLALDMDFLKSGVLLFII